MTRTRIKICGITRAQDAEAAVAAGADAVGLIFAESKRRVTLEQAAGIAAAVPPPVARIGVFVDPELAFVEEAICAAGLTAVQLSGDESPELCDAISIPCIKVIAVGTDFGFSQAEPFRGHATALLLDTYDSQLRGGTSQTFSWQRVGVVSGWAPVCVAGGLTPGNVGEAIAAMRPFAVDVSSGVESAPGIKDHALIEAFCAAVRAADAAHQSPTTVEESR